ncbi:MAG TPA: PAC2 family protein [Chloroflexota bacterium]|nr:PAC2 family protein [Chloroflexota bacterium]
MEHVRLYERPELRAPVLIAAFSGWNDAAACATSAVRLLVEQWRASKFADIDPEDFYDFSVNRPRVRLDDKLMRRLEWPANEFYYYQAQDQPHDFVFFLGQEPSLKWRTFTSNITGLAKELGVSHVVLAGALIADVIHTMPVHLSGSSSDPEMRERMARLNITSSRYEGPTGIVGTLTDRCGLDGLRAISIWGAVPHYIPTTPNPKVVASLLRHMRDLLGFDLELGDLETAARRFEDQVTEAVNANEQLRDYIRERESKEREEEATEPMRMEDFPSGETVVRSLEEFLRQNRRQQPND